MKSNEPSLFSEHTTTSPIPFLEAVAKAYHFNFTDLSEFCFVFPNKRAGTFFLNHLREASPRTILAPEVTSITDFVALLADHDVASRIDLLFRLYNIYRDYHKTSTDPLRSESDTGVFSDFDSFRSWGETLLSDFSEVDQYDVNADALFKNVKDYREIASSFLTDEQIEVMVRYFGYAPGLKEVERFWKNMTPPSDIKNKFILLWQQMAPLYHALNDALDAERLCTSGRAYRLALQRLKDKGAEILPWKKVVMVGFNALSTTEALIFEELKSIPPTEGIPGDFAEFFWDGTGPVLEDALNDAATFLKYNQRNFPSPEWAEEWLKMSRTDTLPYSLRAIGAPSNAAQGKIAGEEVGHILSTEGSEEIRSARTAVVLPDENLLMPFLYSIPEQLNAVNLTMGYPLRFTSVMSFVYHLRRVRNSSRISNGEIAFFHSDLRILLTHPFIHSLIGSKTVSEIKGFIGHHHKITVPLSELAQFSDKIADLLRPLPDDAKVKDVTGYLDEVMVTISAALDEGNVNVLKARIDRSHIEVYRDALRRLDNACERHSIEMSANGVFSMVEKLLGGEQVTFEGEPLEGLQVMGLLETRALDFDNLIILSLNDRIMPRKASGRTFIPDALRHGYGLPYSNYREDLFSYYFYRMISRARNVTLIYDARASSGMRSGGMSRYLMQLKYLYAPGTLKFENRKFLLSHHTPVTPDVEKTPLVMDQLMEFTKSGSKRNFSASALKKYFTCPVKFYYESVLGINADKDPSEYMDAAEMGNVVHEVMLNIYFPEDKRKIYLDQPIPVTPETIDILLNDKENLHHLVRRAINLCHFHRPSDLLDTPLSGAALLIGDKIESMIQDVLRYDRSIAPFWLAGGEISGLVEWAIPGSDRKVNMKYAIDRLDFIELPDGKKSFRIVDYKTGNSYIKARNMEDVFNGDENAKNLFQLMLYANLMNLDRKMNVPVRLSIYQLSELSSKGEARPLMGASVSPGGKTSYSVMKTHDSFNEDFLKLTNETLDNIFNPEIPFVAANDDAKCRYCNLATLCGRDI